MKKSIFILTIIMTLALSKHATAQEKIVYVIVGNENISTLVTALKAADLAGALQGDGAFTIFTPTNDAFAKIDSKTLNALLEIQKALAILLTYQVISENITATDVLAALKNGNGTLELKTLNGQVLTVMQKDEKIWLKEINGNYSEIIDTDIMSINGVIHLINTAVIPRE